MNEPKTKNLTNKRPVARPVRVDALVIPPEVSKKPVGFPLMAEAFFSFASVAISEDKILNEFENDTGINLTTIIPKSPIDRMILDSTGYPKEALGKFIDWLIENYWGEAG